jgi:hypothetical protein
MNIPYTRTIYEMTMATFDTVNWSAFLFADSACAQLHLTGTFQYYFALFTFASTADGQLEHPSLVPNQNEIEC